MDMEGVAVASDDRFARVTSPSRPAQLWRMPKVFADPNPGHNNSGVPVRIDNMALEET
jgi:hypothetical protein